MSVPDDHGDDIALSGEYVLHLLDAEERKAFETRLTQEPQLRDMVREWDATFILLAGEIPSVPPPARLKSQIYTQLFSSPAPAVTGGGLWRWLAGGLITASLIAGLAVLGPMLGPQDAVPTLSANVASEDGTLIVAARFFAEENSLEVNRSAGTAPPGRVLELWLIAEGAAAPVSLGVLSPDTTMRIDLPRDLAAQMSGGILAISDEPPGGSPTGAPTGAVLATGAVTDA